MSAARRILIVDDEIELAEIIKETFQEEGILADSCASGREALVALGQNRYDAVLTDIKMPKMDGLDLLKEIKSKPNSPAVVLMSAYEALAIEDLHHQGASDFIPKPFSSRDALRLVSRAAIPASDRWKAESLFSPTKSEMFLGLKFKSIEDAILEGSIHLGSGGLFLRLGPAFLPQKPVDVHFSFEFKDGPIPHMEGLGRIKWVRHRDQLSKPSGCGIEIIQLAPHCLALIVSEVSRLQSTNFIPKS
jgi:CheY-like chemotaxis protein